jgi:hypothetical protein
MATISRQISCRNDCAWRTRRFQQDRCPDCPPDAPHVCPTYRCWDCFTEQLLCHECCGKRHQCHPLHIIEVWLICEVWKFSDVLSIAMEWTTFRKTSLKSLGLHVQLGHKPGSICFSPQAGHQGFVVVHTNGIHSLAVDFCGCGSDVRGYLSISLLPLWSPTSPLSICIPHPHLCTISKDHTYSWWLSRWSNNFPEVDSPIIVDFPTPTPLVP